MVALKALASLPPCRQERYHELIPSPTAQTPKELANKIAAAIDKALTGDSVAREFCLTAGMYPRLSPIFALWRLARAQSSCLWLPQH